MGRAQDRLTPLEGLREVAAGRLADPLTAALLVARIDDGHVDSAAVRTRIDALAAAFRPAADALLAQHATDPDAVATANALGEALVTQLHDDAGLTGDVADYYDPANSRIDAVLDSGTGIPITLGVVYLAVARAAGVDLAAVNFPAHLLLRLAVDDTAVLIDPFSGVLLGLEEAQQRLSAIHGEATPLTARHLQPMTTADLLLRMLNNLLAIRAERGELERALELVDLMLVAAPEHPLALQRKAELAERLGSIDAARLAWQALLEQAATDEARSLINRHLRRLGGA